MGLSPACAVRGVEDFIVKYGEVEGEPQANGVCWRQLAHGDITGGFVRDQTVLRRFLPVVPCGKLRQVPVVVTLPTGRERERERGRKGEGVGDRADREKDKDKTIGYKLYKLYQDFTLAKNFHCWDIQQLIG